MASLLLPGALVVYIVGIVLGIVGTVYRSERTLRFSAGVFLAAWGLQLAAIIERGLLVAGFSIRNVAEYLLVLSWLVQTLYLMVWARWRIHVVGLVLPPFAALMGFVSLQLLPPEAISALAPNRSLFLFHTTVATLGMAILCVAFAMSLLYLVQDWALKSKRTLLLLQRLPPLDRCDRIGLHSLTIGFLLLSVGIGTGVVINAATHHTWWMVTAKQTFPLLAWLVFAAILFSRTVLGYRGRKSAYLMITGFALGLLTIVGMTL